MTESREESDANASMSGEAGEAGEAAGDEEVLVREMRRDDMPTIHRMIHVSR